MRNPAMAALSAMIAGMALRADSDDRNGAFVARSKHHVIPQGVVTIESASIMHTNRLAQEKSPYLLQHAHNPVDWYAWGPDAFQKARAEDKPIFLSIGYSTCHWCHVMERESFENDQIAQVLNESFVSIKVDREERPDVDRIYMLFVQTATGSGGWPMSVFLTPDRKPFFGGTYFPPDNRWGRPGFRVILESLARSWKEDRARVEESGAQVLEQLRQHSEVAADGTQPPG